jgi:hypothetical protein
MPAAVPHPTGYSTPPPLPAGLDRMIALLPPAAPDRTTAPLPPAATLLLSSHEMFHRMMAAPWANRPPARAVPTRRP